MTRLSLIDDERGVTEFIQRVAEEQDFAVHATNGPTSFMESFKNLPPSAIILDLAMPEIDGVELLRWLPRDTAPTPAQGARSKVMSSSHEVRSLPARL
jgi:two-component system response regulator ResD